MEDIDKLTIAIFAILGIMTLANVITIYIAIGFSALLLSGSYCLWDER